MAKDRMITRPTMLVIGGSAGSLDVLLEVIPRLYNEIVFPIVIVIHRKNTSDVSLAALLNDKTALTVKEAEEKDLLKPSTIYLAPPDYHLLIEKDNTLSLDDSEKVNYSRPSIDVTLLSAADVFGGKVVGLLLSGANADGVEGLEAIKAAGGIVAVQDPITAQVSYMPQQAADLIQIDAVLKPGEIATYINSLSELP